jgi:hypothetical protein
MTKPAPPAAPRQQAWFAAVREGIERETGRSVGDWAKLVRETCPVTGHRERQVWLKQTHGLGVNRGGTILQAAFPSDYPGWGDPDGLLNALFVAPADRAAYEAIAAEAAAWEAVTIGPRKQFVGLSRRFQFAAVSPAKAGGLKIGLALPEGEGRLAIKRKEPWSERLKSVRALAAGDGPDAGLIADLRAAYELS